MIWTFRAGLQPVVILIIHYIHMMSVINESFILQNVKNKCEKHSHQFPGVTLKKLEPFIRYHNSWQLIFLWSTNQQIVAALINSMFSL